MDTQSDGFGSTPGRAPRRGQGSRQGSRHARRRRRFPLAPLAAVAAVVCAGSVGALALQPTSSGTRAGGASPATVVGTAGAGGARTTAGTAGAAPVGGSPRPTQSARPTAGSTAWPTTRPTARSAAKPTQQPSRTRTPSAPNTGTAAGTGGTGGAGGPSADYAVQQVLAVINQARAQTGLPAYTLTQGLIRSAGAHNQVMMGGCGLSHQCPGEAGLGTRITDAGVNWSACGENIGEGGPMADTQADIARMAVNLTRSMLAEQPPDDGHRRNILSSSFHHIGIVVQRTGDGTVYMTQDFSD